MKHITLDIETTGLNVFKDKIIIIGLKENDNPAYILRNFCSLPGLLSDTTIIGHNTSFDLKFLIYNGLISTDVLNTVNIIDTKILSFYNNPHESHKLDDVAKKYLNKQKTLNLKELCGKGKHKISVSDIDRAILEDYCKNDVELAWELYQYFKLIKLHD